MGGSSWPSIEPAAMSRQLRWERARWVEAGSSRPSSRQGDIEPVSIRNKKKIGKIGNCCRTSRCAGGFRPFPAAASRFRRGGSQTALSLFPPINTPPHSLLNLTFILIFSPKSLQFFYKIIPKNSIYKNSSTFSSKMSSSTYPSSSFGDEDQIG